MTDFRALCAELTDCLEKADWPHRYKVVFQQWTDIAHAALADAALAQSEWEGPSDEELAECYRKAYYAHENRQGPVAQVAALRAVLARWGGENK